MSFSEDDCLFLPRGAHDWILGGIPEVVDVRCRRSSQRFHAIPGILESVICEPLCRNALHFTAIMTPSAAALDHVDVWVSMPLWCRVIGFIGRAARAWTSSASSRTIHRFDPVCVLAETLFLVICGLGLFFFPPPCFQLVILGSRILERGDACKRQFSAKTLFESGAFYDLRMLLWKAILLVHAMLVIL